MLHSCFYVTFCSLFHSFPSRLIECKGSALEQESGTGSTRPSSLVLVSGVFLFLLILHFFLECSYNSKVWFRCALAASLLFASGLIGDCPPLSLSPGWEKKNINPFLRVSFVLGEPPTDGLIHQPTPSADQSVRWVAEEERCCPRPLRLFSCSSSSSSRPPLLSLVSQSHHPFFSFSLYLLNFTKPPYIGPYICNTRHIYISLLFMIFFYIKSLCFS